MEDFIVMSGLMLFCFGFGAAIGYIQGDGNGHENGFKKAADFATVDDPPKGWTVALIDAKARKDKSKILAE